MPRVSTLASSPAFVPFSTLHAGVVLVCVVLAVGFVLLGRRWQGSERGAALWRAWAVAVCLVQAWSLLYWASPARANLGTSLPLHVCDLAGLVAVVAVWAPRRILQTVMVYWGLGLSTQAFVTPVLEEGPDTARFWLFFASHATIVGTGLFELALRGYRPAWRDLGVACVLTLIYGAIVTPLNALLGWNYGYTGPSTPGQPTIVDVLGPWPTRLVAMGAVALGFFALLTALLRAIMPPSRADRLSRTALGAQDSAA